MQIRKAGDRGFFDYGWLKTAHSFSFAGYYDPAWMGWGPLRVMNDDIVEPGGGFPLHPHREMEILSYVVEGNIKHQDSMGNESTLGRGEIQVMSAGTGIVHSEFNPSATNRLRLLQIWLMPNKRGVTPRYEQRSFDAGQTGVLQLLAGPAVMQPDALVSLHADAALYRAVLEPDQQLGFSNTGQSAWLQVVNGNTSLNNQRIRNGDGVVITGQQDLQLTAISNTEFLLFDLY